MLVKLAMLIIANETLAMAKILVEDAKLKSKLN